MQSNQPKVLVVDDEYSVRELLEIMLEMDGYEVTCAETGKQALDAIRRQEFDLVITDIRMEPINGLEVLKQVKTVSPRTVVIIISAYASTETAVEAMNEGAYDYLPKPFDMEEMRAVIRHALQSKGEAGAGETTKEGPLYFGCLIGESPAMRKVYDLIKRIAGTGSNVLITGESGTGKELVAKAIHRQSPRKDLPFVVVNCGGVPESLIESELFGYKKGAFTGAATNRMGLVEAAQGGTLFLDEIGELSPVLQVKLLRLVQEKTIKMIGGNEDIPVDVRILSATNRDLEKMVIEGTFREDLYYRLNVLPIRIPPLRERKGDIPILAHYFLNKFCKEFGKQIRKISSYAMDILNNYEFPGNVRELEHIIERGVALEASSIILPDSLTLSSYKRSRHPSSQPREASQDSGGAPLREVAPQVASDMFPSIALPPKGIDLEQYLADIEKTILQKALAQAGGVKTKAAELLGINARSMRYRLEKYGLAAEDE
ncbi:MAG: sigma-54-dependent Fis family transcriptional regulator [Deltaproteobacteria bacterium]|nr:sigma-54-dependent Fis family transcriptional regulator [Deltaproteobacteria bacterium]